LQTRKGKEEEEGLHHNQQQPQHNHKLRPEEEEEGVGVVVEMNSWLFRLYSRWPDRCLQHIRLSAVGSSRYTGTYYSFLKIQTLNNLWY
jgi:hypothetical protein